jgi:hypothetical protein
VERSKRAVTAAIAPTKPAFGVGCSLVGQKVTILLPLKIGSPAGRARI